MVNLVVKGTRHTDEFVFEADASLLCGDVAPVVTHVVNMRHRVRLQLYSVSELLPAAQKANPTGAQQLKSLYDEVLAVVKNTSLVIKPTQFDEYWVAFRDLVVAIFPNEGQSKDGPEAAVTRLYELHENPDIDEDYRLHVYHCRAVLDPEYRQNEMEDEKAAAMWFCAKEMPADATLGKYCANNNKSKITVKIAKSSGPPPSKEPRISYDQQRDLRKHMVTRQEELKSLEDSELRDRVLQQSRGKIALAAPSSGSSDVQLRTAGLKPIFNNAKETEVETQ